MAYSGPSKQDFITQIEGDLKTEGGETDEVLNARLEAVQAADSDEAAHAAYFGHLEESKQSNDSPAEEN